jgi:hypothetical protein
VYSLTLVQEDWRYWVFTSIMGHFVHSFAQEVSNISPDDMERDALLWVQVGFKSLLRIQNTVASILAVLRIRDILVRIRNRGSVILINASGSSSGSWYFRQ